LARHHVNIITGVWSVHVRRSLWASLIATAVMAAVYAVPSWDRGLGLVSRFVGAVVVGVLAYGVVVVLLRRHIRRAAFKGVRLD